MGRAILGFSQRPLMYGKKVSCSMSETRNWLGKSSNGLGPVSFEEAVLVISAKDCDFQFQSLCLFVL